VHSRQDNTQNNTTTSELEINSLHSLNTQPIEIANLNLINFTCLKRDFIERINKSKRYEITNTMSKDSNRYIICQLHITK